MEVEFPVVSLVMCRWIDQWIYNKDIWIGGHELATGWTETDEEMDRLMYRWNDETPDVWSF